MNNINEMTTIVLQEPYKVQNFDQAYAIIATNRKILNIIWQR